MSATRFTKLSRVMLAGIILIAFCSIAVFAQEEKQKGQLYVVTDYLVKPSEEGAFEAASKEYVANAVLHKFPYGWTTLVGDNFHYYVAIAVEDHADIGNFYKTWGDFQKKMGEEKSQALFKRSTSAYEYYREGITRSKPELSYTPANPRLQPDEGNFYHWYDYYVIPGKEKEFEAVLKEWLALYKAANFTDGYAVYAGGSGTGTDLPVYGMLISAKGPADFYSQFVNNWELLGEERHSLYKKTVSLMRKQGQINAWSRPDLSYTPEKE